MGEQSRSSSVYWVGYQLPQSPPLHWIRGCYGQDLHLATLCIPTHVWNYEVRKNYELFCLYHSFVYLPSSVSFLCISCISATAVNLGIYILIVHKCAWRQSCSLYFFTFIVLIYWHTIQLDQRDIRCNTISCWCTYFAKPHYHGWGL